MLPDPRIMLAATFAALAVIVALGFGIIGAMRPRLDIAERGWLRPTLGDDSQPEGLAQRTLARRAAELDLLRQLTPPVDVAEPPPVAGETTAETEEHEESPTAASATLPADTGPQLPAETPVTTAEPSRTPAAPTSSPAPSVEAALSPGPPMASQPVQIKKPASVKRAKRAKLRPRRLAVARPATAATQQSGFFLFGGSNSPSAAATRR